MINLEWLKNVNSLLSEVIDLAEGEFSAGKWLDFATSTAKQLSRFSFNPFSSLSSQESSVDTHASNTTGQSNPTSTASENTRPEINLMDLWKLLKPAQSLFKQISAMEPVIRTIINPRNIKPANLKPSSILNSDDNFFPKKTALNWLALALLPIFLMNLGPRFR